MGQSNTKSGVVIWGCSAAVEALVSHPAASAGAAASGGGFAAASGTTALQQQQQRRSSGIPRGSAGAAGGEAVPAPGEGDAFDSGRTEAAPAAAAPGRGASHAAAAALAAAVQSSLSASLPPDFSASAAGGGGTTPYSGRSSSSSSSRTRLKEAAWGTENSSGGNADQLPVPLACAAAAPTARSAATAAATVQSLPPHPPRPTAAALGEAAGRKSRHSSSASSSSAAAGGWQATSFSPPRVVDTSVLLKSGTAACSISSIACAGRHAALLTNAGALYMWGDNACGQLGTGDTSDVSGPRLLRHLHAGKVVAKVACGPEHTLCCLTDGRAYAWGCGLNGRLGLHALAIPRVDAAATLAALPSSSSLSLCSSSSTSPLLPGTPSGGASNSTPVSAAASASASAAAAAVEAGTAGRQGGAPRATAAAAAVAAAASPTSRSQQQTKTSGSIGTSCVATGLQQSQQQQPQKQKQEQQKQKQLREGMAEEPPVSRCSVHTPRLLESLLGCFVSDVACGMSHSAFLAVCPPEPSSRSLLTCGLGLDGRLGHGDEEDRHLPTAVGVLEKFDIASVSCGAHHTACVTSDGALYAWGGAAFGKLGAGASITSAAQLLPQRVAGPLLGKRVSSVALGAQHSACITTDGELYTWGQGRRLGHEWLHGEELDEPLPRRVDILAHAFVIQVVCGEAHTACLVNSGDVWAWGSSWVVGHGEAAAPANRPTRITALQGKGALLLACSSLFTAALCDPRCLMERRAAAAALLLEQQESSGLTRGRAMKSNSCSSQSSSGGGNTSGKRQIEGSSTRADSSEPGQSAAARRTAAAAAAASTAEKGGGGGAAAAAGGGGGGEEAAAAEGAAPRRTAAAAPGQDSGAAAVSALPKVEKELLRCMEALRSISTHAAANSGNGDGRPEEAAQNQLLETAAAAVGEKTNEEKRCEEEDERGAAAGELQPLQFEPPQQQRQTATVALLSEELQTAQQENLLLVAVLRGVAQQLSDALRRSATLEQELLVERKKSAEAGDRLATLRAHYVEQIEQLQQQLLQQDNTLLHALLAGRHTAASAPRRGVTPDPFGLPAGIAIHTGTGDLVGGSTPAGGVAGKDVAVSQSAVLQQHSTPLYLSSPLLGGVCGATSCAAAAAAPGRQQLPCEESLQQALLDPLGESRTAAAAAVAQKGAAPAVSTALLMTLPSVASEAYQSSSHGNGRQPLTAAADTLLAYGRQMPVLPPSNESSTELLTSSSLLGSISGSWLKNSGSTSSFRASTSSTTPFRGSSSSSTLSSSASSSRDMFANRSTNVFSATRGVASADGAAALQSRSGPSSGLQKLLLQQPSRLLPHASRAARIGSGSNLLFTERAASADARGDGGDTTASAQQPRAAGATGPSAASSRNSEIPIFFLNEEGSAASQAPVM